MSYLPLKPIPMKNRISMIFLQYGQIDVQDGAFVLIDKNGVRTHIPVGSVGSATETEKRQLTLRLSPEAIDGFKSTDWRHTRVDEALVVYGFSLSHRDGR